MGVHSGKVRSFTKMRLIKFLLPLFLVAASTTAFSQKRIAAYNKLKEVIKEEGPEAADGYIEKLKDEFDFDSLSKEEKAELLEEYNDAKALGEQMLEDAHEILEFQEVDNYREEFRSQWEDVAEDEVDEEEWDDANDGKFSAKRIEAYNRAMTAAKEQLEYAEELMGYEMVDNYNEDWADQWEDFDIDSLSKEEKAKLIEEYNEAKSLGEQMLEDAHEILEYQEVDNYREEFRSQWED